MPKVHIVIPCFNGWAMTHEILWNLHRKERGNIDSVLVIDNASDEEAVKDGLIWWQDSALFPFFSYYRQSENLGFLENANTGLSLVCNQVNDDDLVILLSNDVLVYSKFISQILLALDENPKSLVGGILYTHDTGWNTFNGKTFPYLEGWLLATTVKNWKELDYFDIEFCPCDYEDIDLSTYAISIGYQLVPLNNVGLVHKAAQTIKYGAERMDNTIKNKKKFEAKWVK
jgi:GT2 family glycosyltransferase